MKYVLAALIAALPLTSCTAMPAGSTYRDYDEPTGYIPGYCIDDSYCSAGTVTYGKLAGPYPPTPAHTKAERDYACKQLRTNPNLVYGEKTEYAAICHGEKKGN